MIELTRRQGRFGLIRVLERKSDGARLYCINRSLQTMIQADGVSLFGYVHAIKILLRQARRVLVIGGAGGSLATMMARNGQSVTVLDIDPAAEELARSYFQLDTRVNWVTAEPFAFLEAQHTLFDAVAVDACDDQGLAWPFHRADMLTSLLRRAAPGGALALNLVHEDGAPPWGAALSAMIGALGHNVTLYRSEQGWEGNEVVHVRSSGADDTWVVDDIHQRPPETQTYLMSLRAHRPRPAAGWIKT